MLDLRAQVVLSTAYHPQTDGQSEHQYCSLEQILYCFVSPRQHDWDLLLPYAKFALNSSYSASTGFSPAYTLYGRKPNFLLEAAVYSITDSRAAYILDHVAHMSDVVQSIHKTLTQTPDSIEKQANPMRCDIGVCVGGLACLSTKH